MGRMKITLLAGVMLVFALSCYAQESVDAEQLLASGNNYYEKGEYGKAIEEYSGIVKSGESSAAVYYNLAGSYFKSGDLGGAILNYGRALTMAPRDADIRANFRFARSMVTGKAVSERGFWSWRPVRLYSWQFTVNEMTIITSAAFFFFFVLCAAAVMLPQIKKYLIALATVTAVFVILSSSVIAHKIRMINSYAVTVVPQAEALFGPFDTATKFFMLYEGNGVTVLKDKDDWYKVRRSDGKIGWVKRSEVERI